MVRGTGTAADQPRRSVLAPPRPPVVAAALSLARRWCAGHTIDGDPALLHAVRVARKLGLHWPTVPPGLVAAVLLHDAPDYVEDAALARMVTAGCGGRVLADVRALHREHELMGLYPTNPAQAVARLSVIPPDLRVALAADKAVSLAAILRRGRLADDPDRFWADRPAFVGLIPYLRAFAATVVPALPGTLSVELATLVATAEATVIRPAGVGEVDRWMPGPPRRSARTSDLASSARFGPT
jgi:hypothetical protein